MMADVMRTLKTEVCCKKMNAPALIVFYFTSILNRIIETTAVVVDVLAVVVVGVTDLYLTCCSSDGVAVAVLLEMLMGLLWLLMWLLWLLKGLL